MRCHECLRDVGPFDALLPVYRLQLSGYGDNETEGVELDGYAHAWHFQPPSNP